MVINNSTKVNPSPLIIILTVLILVKGDGGDVCSTFCATNGCTTWDSNGCNSKCYNGWTWDTISATCGFDAASQKAIMDYTADAGGDAVVSPDPGTFACDFTNQGSGVGVGTTYFGAYLAP